MTQGAAAHGGLQRALDRLRPHFDAIADGAARRDAERLLPHNEVRLLSAAGFGSLRVPVELGGSGLTIPQLAVVLLELGAADPNLLQIFRGHLGFTEDVLTSPPSDWRDRWLARFAAGELVGNAWAESGNVELWKSQTIIQRSESGWAITGRKFYTTGSLYADWIDTLVHRPSDGTDVVALVRAHQETVVVSDDWDGFGQQLTGTGSVVFDEAHVDLDQVRLLDERFGYQTPFYQFILLTVMAGIARAAARETANAIRERARVYSQGNAPFVREDPQILAVIGEIAATAFAAEALVSQVATALQHAHDVSLSGDRRAIFDAAVAAEIAAAQAQIVISQSVPVAATRLFDTLGASAISRSQGLDRHWRNARTVASHNPWIFRAKAVGAWVVNRTDPPLSWTVGTTPSQGG